MAYYTFQNSLLRFLGIDTNKSYTMAFIRSKLQVKKPNQKDFKHLFPTYSGCCCGSCPVDINELINFIKKELIIKSDKPECYFYEFNQKPVNVNFISLEN